MVRTQRVPVRGIASVAVDIGQQGKLWHLARRQMQANRWGHVAQSERSVRFWVDVLLWLSVFVSLLHAWVPARVFSGRSLPG
jgi:hypothetical protein